MRSPQPMALGLLGALFATSIALADDAPPPAAAAGARIAEIPAHCVETVVDVHVPPRTAMRRVPVYETVAVPVYEERCVPEYRDVEVPVFETREVPVYRTEKVPVWGEKSVPITEEVCDPVKICLWNPFACKKEEIKLWNRTRTVEVGQEQRTAIVAYEEQQVEAGTRLERFQAGTETRQVFAGNRVERVQVGTREEQRIVDWRDEQVVTAPAAVRQERRVAQVPCERVTVVPESEASTPALPGTSRVLTERAYREALAQAR